MSVISFFRGSVMADPLVAMEEMLRRLRSLPPANGRRKSVKNALSNGRIPAHRSLRKVKPILVAGAAILTLSLPALNGQVRLRPTSERAGSRGIVREWRWSVRAQGSDGQWGKWSEEQPFDVAYIP